MFTGRVYISRDVVFYETQFPFEKLHPNAGALLNNEFLLLPCHLLGDDPMLTNSSLASHESSSKEISMAENGVMNDELFKTMHKIILAWTHQIRRNRIRDRCSNLRLDLVRDRCSRLRLDPPREQCPTSRPVLHLPPPLSTTLRTPHIPLAGCARLHQGTARLSGFHQLGATRRSPALTPGGPCFPTRLCQVGPVRGLILIRLVRLDLLRRPHLPQRI